MRVKYIYLICLVSIFILIFSTQVSAGWWNNLFKTVPEQQVNSMKTNILIESKSEVKITNYEKGMQWERNIETNLCKAVGGCLYTAESAAKRLRWSYGKEEVFIIYGGKETNKFINNNGLYKTWSGRRFTKEPDFLEIKQINGKIMGIKIIDAKTSKTAVRAEQDIAFLELCRLSNIPCEVEYVIPKSSLSKSDANFLCLATIPLAFTGPVGLSIDALCFLATS